MGADAGGPVADQRTERGSAPPVAAGFEATFRAAYPKAMRVARRIVGDPATAEDVTAEAFTRAYLHWRKLADEPWREAWVMRVTANLAIDTTRRRPPPVAPAVVGSDAEDLVVLRRALVAALQHLPRRQREVVVLRYLVDLSEAETAGLLGVSEGAVKTHLHRGIGALRRSLGASVEEDFHVVTP